MAINNIIFCYCFIFYSIINSKRKFHIGPNSKLLALPISISMFVLLSNDGECFEQSSMLEFFFSSTCYLTKSTHSEQKTKCTHISCSVESMQKSTFDPYSGTWRAIPQYHNFGIKQASIPSGNSIPGLSAWFPHNVITVYDLFLWYQFDT